MNTVIVNDNSSLPKYKQIVASIEKAIVEGALKKGDKLPSLNSIKTEFQLSRDTVLSAFNELKNRGIIKSIVGKGYYVLSEDIAVSQKIFLLFDELNAFKEDVYTSFLNRLGAAAQVDIFFHHFNERMFSKLINDNVDGYSHFVIMPANLPNAYHAISALPQDKVYIIDQTHSALKNYPSVHQNFRKDMHQGLTDGLPLLQKYQRFILVFSEIKQPQGMRDGFVMFCEQHGFEYEIITNFKDSAAQQGDLYVVLEDKDLIIIIKHLKETPLTLAKDVGVISYNDTLLKTVVENGITTISTDFKLMGEQLADMILKQEFEQIENPSRLIIRHSI